MYDLLREQLPEVERVLVGREAIVLHLWHLGVTQRSKRPVTRTALRGWARRHGFPLTPGTRRGRNYDACRDSVATQPPLQRAPDAGLSGATVGIRTGVAGCTGAHWQDRPSTGVLSPAGGSEPVP